MRYLIALLILLCSYSTSLAKDLYVDVNSTGGSCSDSTSYAANSISSPWCSFSKAFTSPEPGDNVYFRAGTYSISSAVNTKYNTNPTSAGTRVLFSNYNDETVNFNSSLSRAVYIDRDYYEVDGVNFTAPGTFWVLANTYNAMYFKLENSVGTMTAQGGSDNYGCVYFQASRSSHGLVENNIFYGPGAGLNLNTSGVVLFRAQGVKILNNSFYNFPRALYYKHTCIGSDTGIEFAYNYFTDNGVGIISVAQYADIHDNLLVGDDMVFGSDGGIGDDGSNAGSDHNNIHHNTFYGGTINLIRSGSNDGSGAQYNTIKDNVFTGEANIFEYESLPHYSTMDYNLYNPTISVVNDRNNYTLSGWKTYYGQDSNSVSGAPTFVGGGSPSTFSDFALTGASLGYGAASDAADMGADMSLVGPDAVQGTDTTAPEVISATASVVEDRVTINFSENAVTTGYDNGDFKITCVTAGSNIDLNSITGTGSSRVFTAASSVGYNDTCTLAYSGGADEIEDDAGNDLATFSGFSIAVATSEPPGTNAVECTDYEITHPNWIYCDDFEGASFETNYANYNLNSGALSRSGTVAKGGDYSIKFQYTSGDYSESHLWRTFGTNPAITSQSDNGTDFDEIYWRFYMYLDANWTGNPYKVTRITMFTGADWSQGMVSHLWPGDGDLLKADPTSCTTGSSVDCSGYNDIGAMTWLGAVDGITPIYGGAYNGKWVAIENRVKLNTPGQSDGLHQVWIDGVLEISRTGLNYRDSYTGHGLNAIQLEAYWNGGADATQARYYDNFVISTAPIGLVGEEIINGACGANDSGTFLTLLSADADNCTTGTVANFSGTGPWSWDCDGYGSGTDDTGCSASLEAGSTGSGAQFAGAGSGAQFAGAGSGAQM